MLTEKERAALLSRPDLAASRAEFEKACAASRAHNAAALDAMMAWGDHGSLISGCVRDHLPNEVKDFLRVLARAVTEHSDAARAARPKGVRRETIYRLGRCVATRDGHGRYGPQAWPA